MYDYASGCQTAEQSSSGFNFPDVDIQEITQLREKRKWMDNFTKAYSGSLIEIQPVMFTERCRYFKALVEGKEAGFIRISNYTDVWKKYYDGEVWSASDAYVKKTYRNNTILRQLLSFVMGNCNVKAVRLETERLNKNAKYYNTLGFTYGWSFDEGKLSIAVVRELEEAAIKRNADYAK